MSFASIRRPGQPAPVAEQAAEWVLRREAGALDDADQQAFEAWLAEDPANVEAYEDAVWALDAAARHAAAPELMAMREAALAARGDRASRPWLWTGLAGAVAASLVAFWLLLVQPAGSPAPTGPIAAESPADPRSATYATAIGERLAVTLPDGSVATLDTNSRIRVAYSGAERGIHLLRGQALFEVAHDRPLPFQVHAAGHTVTAVGTTFNVRLYGETVRVALLDGVVQVRPSRPAAPAAARTDPAPPRPLVMRAGELLQLGPSQPVRVASAAVTQVASWRGGELVFNDTRLADAVAEINRYTRRPIAIADAAVADYRVTGVFRTNDPERFSQAMSEVFGLEVTHGPNGAPILRSRD